MIHSGDYPGVPHGLNPTALCGRRIEPDYNHHWMPGRGNDRFRVNCPVCLGLLNCKSNSEKQGFLQKLETSRATTEMKVIVQDLLDRTQHYE